MQQEGPGKSLSDLIRARFPESTLTALDLDASTRTFYRLNSPVEPSRIVMDYGSPFAGETDDIRLTRLFSTAGLPVPEIIDSFPEAGCLLLTDLGPNMLQDELIAARDQGRTPDLLLAAAELAASIARDGTPVLSNSDRAGGPRLDFDRFRFEMEFFVENYLGRYKKIRADGGGCMGPLVELARLGASTPQPVLCHRDFHSRNLIVRADGTLAMVDIQDAQWGPDSYDLASLVCDAYVDLSPQWVEDAVVRYLGSAGIADDQAFRDRLHLVAAQRMIKALGTFGYQLEVVGNARYLSSISRTLIRLDNMLGSHPQTSELSRLFTQLGLFDATP